MKRSVSTSLLKNINSELCINFLKVKLTETKRVVHKIFILVRNNVPEHISEATQQFIKEKKINDMKDCPAFSPDLNPIEMYGNNKNGTLKEGFEKNELIKQLERLKIKFQKILEFQISLIFSEKNDKMY